VFECESNNKQGRSIIWRIFSESIRVNTILCDYVRYERSEYLEYDWFPFDKMDEAEYEAAY